jgi:putative holliday junction resolvase
MYVIGFDYGTKRIGVAVGQSLTATARPLTIVLVKNEQIDWQVIHALIQEWQPEAFVVGLPKYADGTDNFVTVAVREFCQQLQVRYQLPVHTIDETLSSVAAVEKILLKKKGKGKKNPKIVNLDAVAAQVILETWFALD